MDEMEQWNPFVTHAIPFDGLNISLIVHNSIGNSPLLKHQ
jgi:hypothetical protein